MEASTDGVNETAVREIARRRIWWKTPEEALRDPVRVASQVMCLGTWDEVQALRRALGDAWFQRALQDPPPGVFDARSWNFWHIRLGLTPVPPLPDRALP